MKHTLILEKKKHAIKTFLLCNHSILEANSLYLWSKPESGLKGKANNYFFAFKAETL